ncbi:SGNH/GDSL hydrolase family protein [Bifidobacterium scardovii]|uniref:Uncharacterized protein n=1 Tax=Bifidobacterium scardovii TaxID=158787 RepID=A0A087D403_9BIFI|nr:SGNH/GDSL hydrolase family protein [Bifidobacterium scardovii]KFI90253.1 hypothetical protein BSCA_1864 [Bifidobacterium scardovii]MDK6350063.1 SGNH/GDSL hydrolase family protein [Bifidobacterium scardovii]MDU8982184.1 SGNH/GDSL hydrolase family protein [Bifidobacterium scardovii]BAQ30512.1 hypothetical protein BBSC_0432 [Bifidobacterium scardovii JCM 12489 = DSM 13734]
MNGINQTRAIPAGTHAVWCGDSVTLGTGSSTTTKRYSTLVSGELNLTEHNYAKTNAGYLIDGNTIGMQLDTAKTDTGYPHNQVGYVFLMTGLTDSYQSLANMQQAVSDTIGKARSIFTAARIVVGVGPGCIPDADDTEAIAKQGHILTAITLAAVAADALVIRNMRAICGSDPDMHATGINPNDEGMRLLAQAVVASVDADKGEPLDTPVTDLTRVYTSPGADWATRQVNAQRKREASKKEANRPTGTELTQLTSKLDELTQTQGLQQVIIEQQQAALAKQQAQLEAQQEQLKAAQDQLKSQQASLEAQQKQLGQIVDQLKGIVDDQGSTVSQLKTVTDNLAATDGRVDQIQHTLYDNQVWLKTQLDNLDRRVTALENKGTVTG